MRQRRNRMEAQGVFHTEERFVEIRRQIKEQDRRLLEMGIEISTPKTIHYFVSVCGVERELTHSKFQEFKALGAKVYTKTL